MCKFQAYNEGLVIEITFSMNPLIQRVSKIEFYEHLKTSMLSKMCDFRNSHLLRSALLSCPGTLWGERALGGLWPWRGPFGGDWGIWLVPFQVAGHCWTYTDAHKHGGIKRGEQTCQDKVRTWQPGSRSINNTVDKGLQNVFLKCDITAFNGNWAEKVLLSNSCLPIKITTHFLLVFPCCCRGTHSQCALMGCLFQYWLVRISYNTINS